MRIFGAILIVIGLLICLTIIGIPVGMFLIFVGLLMVVFGSRRRTFITNVVQVSTTPSQQSLSMESEVNRERQIAPPVYQPVIDVTPQRQPARTTSSSSAAGDYDRAKWDALVTYDEDVAQVERNLKVLGQPWIDKFAKAYLAINDKSYLPIILNKIIAEARTDAVGRSPSSDTAEV